MENTIFEQAAKFLRERRDNRRWRIAVCCLALLVVCGTAWVLSRNGQAFVSAGAVLDCPLVVHEHTSHCFDKEGRPICGEADYVFHAHNEYCYDVEGGLVCKLEEIEAHEHSEDCFESITILSCDYGTESSGESPEDKTDGNDESNVNAETNVINETNVNSETMSVQDEVTFSADSPALEAGSGTMPVCGMEEHTHSEDCYGNGERSLICGQEEGGHIHDDSCYEETKKKELVCGEEERKESEEGAGDGHTHSDACYEETTEKKLVCGREENSHVHGDECYGGVGEGELICGKTEHEHSEACYEEQQSSGEQKPDDGEQKPDDGEQKPNDGEAVEEPAGHVHDESCTQKVRRLTCGKKGVHIHNSEECYYGDKLICEVPAVRSVEEHNHDKDCFRIDEDEEFTKIYRDDTIVVTAVYTGLAQIPEAAKLRVDMLAKDSSDYEERLAQLAETKDALVEDSELAMLLQIGFYTTDERILPKDTVHFSVHFLDDSFCKEGDAVAVACFADSGVELIPASDIDKENATEFDLKEFADLDIGIIIGGERDRKRVLTYEGAGYIMSVALGENTKVPEDAGLTIDQLTPENSPEGYANRLAQLKEADGILIGEDDIAMLLRVWVSADGVDTRLDEKAEVTMQFLDDRIYAEGDAVMVASFDENGVRLISGKDIDSEGFTTFEVDELSEIAFIVSKERAGVLTYEGEDYIVTVTLGAETRVPEGAELMVEEITQESNPALYEERLAQLESVEDLLSEEEIMALLLHMWVSVDGEEIALGETVDVKVQFINSEIYFEEDAVKAAHFTEDGEAQYLAMLEASAIDADISTAFVSEGLGDFAFITENVRTMTYEGDGFVVTVRFGEAAKIPENAELLAERITQESDPEQFTECEDELREKVEEQFVIMDALLEIGFYVGGKEVEPQDTVDVKIQLLDREELDSEENDSRKVAHFGEDGVEILEDADVFEDEGNSLSTTFQTDSFSLYAVARGTDEVTTAAMFHKAMEDAVKQNAPVTITIGANIEFPQPERNPDGSFGAPYTGCVIQQDGAGDRNRYIIAKLNSEWQGQKEVTLDLNGYKLSVTGKNMALIGVCNDVTLNIVDSYKGSSVRPDGYSTTYEITTSKAIGNTGETVETTENRAVSGGAIVGKGGRETHWDESKNSDDKNYYAYVNEGGNETALITMWYGTLNMKSGILAENGNRAIQAKGGTINLEGGYLLHNAAKKIYEGEAHGAEWNGDWGYAIGGAVVCEDANPKDNGVGDSSKISLTGTILSGNKAIEGGAINVTHGEISITGGYVTHNASYYGKWGRGGGGIQLHGASLTMDGGQITANTTRGGGGGICAARNSAVQISDGFITANATMEANGEGGGVALYEEWAAENGMGWNSAYHPKITIGDTEKNSDKKVYITNNKSNTTIDWGGGGLFVSEGATAYLYNTLITKNKADGFGGGLAGCATGRILDFNDSGAAIYGNSAAGAIYADEEGSTKHADKEFTTDNPAFWERDKDGRYFFQDYFSALYSHFEGEMLGGGQENWDGSIDKVRFTVPQNQWTSSYVAGLTAYPSDDAKQEAQKAARVFITGNTSKTHGGGVMCNGILLIGEAPSEIEISTAMKVEATKALKDGKGGQLLMAPGQFSFSIYEDPDCTKPVATGANVTTEIKDESGKITGHTYDKITFDNLLTFNITEDLENSSSPNPTLWVDGQQYYYRYFIKEDELPDNPNNLGIQKDETVYALTVMVQRVNIEQVTSKCTKFVDVIQGIIVEKYEDGSLGGKVYEKWLDKNEKNTLESHPITFLLTGEDAPSFTNIKGSVTKIKVEKRWSGNDNNGAPNEVKSITVELYKVKTDGTLQSIGTMVLDGTTKEEKEGTWRDGWTGGWTDLEGDVNYEVKETIVTRSDESDEDDEDDESGILKNYTVTYAYSTDADGTTVTITNTPKTYVLELTKIGKNGDKEVPLSGAKFQIYDNADKDNALWFRQVDDGYEYVAGYKSSGNSEEDNRKRMYQDLVTDNRKGKIGTIKISGLVPGKYILEEAKAPQGYVETHAHIIEFGNSGAVSLDCGGEGNDVSVDQGNEYILKFTLIDEEKVYKLPKTGGRGKGYIGILGAILVLGIAVVMYLTRRRRKMALMLAFVLILGMGMTVAASDSADPPKFTVVDDPLVKDHKFTAYRIFVGAIQNGYGALSWDEDFDNVAFVSALKVDTRLGGSGNANPFQPLEADKATAADVAAILEKLGTSAESGNEMARAQAQLNEVAQVAYKYKGTSGKELEGEQTLEAGYYLIVDSTPEGGAQGVYNAAVLWAVPGSGFEIAAKAAKPYAEKKVKENVKYPSDDKCSEGFQGGFSYGEGFNDAADYSIGDTIPFAFYSEVPDMTYYNTYKYVFHDKMAPGLTFDKESVVVKIGGSVVSGYEVVTANLTDECTFEVVFKDLKGIKVEEKVVEKGADILITFNAVLNADAVVGKPGNENDMVLEFSNNPNVETETGRMPDDKVVVFTYQLNVAKVDGEDSTKLKDAEFILYRKTAAGAIEYAVVDVSTAAVGDAEAHEGTDTLIRWSGTEDEATKLKSGEDGSFRIIGLDDGVYYLKETKAPTGGYNTLTDPVIVTITAETKNGQNIVDLTELSTALTKLNVTTKVGETGAWSEVEDGDISTGEVAITVTNYKGTTLPEFGGMGTRIFYIIGGILVLGCGVILIAKKRVKK